MNCTIPKGKLIAVGGNEDKGTPGTKKNKYKLNFFELGILKRILIELDKKEPTIEIITTASMIPLEVADMYLSAFKLLNCTNIGIMHIGTEEEAIKPEYVDRLKNADAVMFTGGDQSRITQMFLGTPFLEVLKDRYCNEADFIIAGTSAGAMAMSEIMITGGKPAASLMKGAVKIGKGLALMSGVIIDSHFVKRGRFGRLIEAVALHDKVIGIGLGEDTGVLITNGHFIETIGSNLVIIIDGHDIKHNNAHTTDKGNPLSIENIELHVLAKGNVYDINTREFFPDFENHMEWLNKQKEPEDIG